MEFHIGNTIKEVMIRKNVSVAQLAERIGKEPSNIYPLLKRNQLSMEDLQKISLALEYNFFFALAMQTWLQSSMLPKEEAQRIYEAINRQPDFSPEAMDHFFSKFSGQSLSWIYRQNGNEPLNDLDLPQPGYYKNKVAELENQFKQRFGLINIVNEKKEGGDAL